MMMQTLVTRTLCFALLALCPIQTVRADDELKAALLRPSIDAMQQALRSGDRSQYEQAVDQFLETPGNFALAAFTDSRDVRFIVEANRIDKQVGSGGRSAGSTNLVSSGSVPRLLGFAVEAGAITQSVSGTSITFRTNPAGLLNTLTQAGFDANPGDTATQNTLSVLRRFNIGLTFDTSRETDGRFTGSYRQLQQLSTQVYLYNRRDPTHPAWSAVWEGFRDRAGVALPNAVRDLAVVLDTQEYKELRKTTLDALLKPGISESEIQSIATDFVEKVRPMIPESAAIRVISAWKAYLTNQNVVYRQLARSPILTLEYELSRPPIQDAPADIVASVPVTGHPDLSTTRLIFVRPFLGASDMTVNASFGFFNETRPGMRGNIRDFQVGGKLDFPLNGVLGVNKAQFTIAGLYMKLRQTPIGIPIVVNGVEVDRSGNLGFVQARIRIPMADSGFSIPFSITYANRTEFIKEKEIRANVGLSLDLERLIGRR